MRVCPRIQKFDFYGGIYLNVGTRIDTQVHEIFGPPPRGPQRAPGGAKDLPKTSSGHKFYIFELHKVHSERPLLVLSHNIIP